MNTSPTLTTGCQPAALSARVTVGPYTLNVGRPAGTLISLSDEPVGDSSPLARAIAEARKAERQEERWRRAPLAEAMQSSADEATKLTEEVERGVRLFRELAEGRHDVLALGDEVGALLDLLMRLDRKKRWEDVLRVARALCTLLALLMRWEELIRSLRIALRAAEELGDLDIVAWASHELGSLHLAAEKARTANDMLGRARELREKSGDRSGLATTNHNLQVLCQLIRTLLREGRLAERKLLARGLIERLGPHPVARAAVVVALFAAGGVAAAAVSGSPSVPSASAYVGNGRGSTNMTSTSATDTSLPPAGSPRGVPAALTPLSLDFGTQEVGNPSSVKTETLANSGNPPLQVSSVTISGADRGDFAISSDHCGRQAVASRRSCTVSVTFTPRSSGSRVATLTFNDKASHGPPPQVTLSGTGYTVPPTTVSRHSATTATTTTPTTSTTTTPTTSTTTTPTTSTTTTPTTTTTSTTTTTTTNPSPTATTTPPLRSGSPSGSGYGS